MQTRRRALTMGLAAAACAPMRGTAGEGGLGPTAPYVWPVAAPEAVGLDAGLLAAADSVRPPWLHSLLVVRRGALAHESYFPGQDEQLGRPLGLVRFDAAAPHDLRSVTKSVVSLLFGMAAPAGLDLDQPVLEQFPDYADLRTPERLAITIRHVLTMSLGVAWNEDISYADPANSERQLNEAPDPVRYTLSRPIEQPAGAAFRYNGGATQVLAALIEKFTGEQAHAYAARALFAPLGISSAYWMTLPGGAPIAASGLRLTPRDMAILGEFIRRGGEWGGRQIAPRAWIEAATRPHLTAFAPVEYGYQFWIQTAQIGGRPARVAMAAGNGGQRIFVIPSQDLVAVTTAGAYNAPDHAVALWRFFSERVLPALRDA